MLFSLVLVLNVSSSSAASVNQTNINTSDKSLEPVGVAISASNYTNTSNVQTNTNINIQKVVNTTTNTTTKDNYQMAAGALVKVNGLTIAQLKNGISRVQAFYKKHHRFPKTVNFGTKKIPFATFKKNIASQNLKIVTKPVTNAVSKPDTSSVAALAKSLTAGSTSNPNKATKIFNWVRDNINYAFYYNTKYGAAGTLQHRQGNCVDTSHLLIALSRAAGITSRYVHGTCQFSSGTWYGHVWAQLYVNGKWVTADATSSRNSLGVIKNWNTGTYKLVGVYNTLPF